jgi:hypothetical protein
MFKYEGGFFVNKFNNQVWDVNGGRDEEARNVRMWKRNGSSAQQWRVVYKDKMGDDAF